MKSPSRKRWRAVVLIASGTLLSGLLAGATSTVASASPAAAESTMNDLIPRPVDVQPDPAATFELTNSTIITISSAPTVSQGGEQARQAADLLAGELRPVTGFPLHIIPVPGFVHLPGISLDLTGDQTGIGPQGYRLDVTDQSVRIQAGTFAGLSNGVQTLRQLLPAKVMAPTVQSGSWPVPGGHILDYPRYSYRGAMLDVARFFYPVSFVEQFINEISYYKFNYLHLHLTDDQGWRLQINSWPRLATYGGSTAEVGYPGGYYTQAQFEQIEAYAQAHGVTVIPEIDVPGHTSAALASYAALNCDGVAPPLYTGFDTGFSSLCLTKPITYTFISQVLREVASITTGKYIDVGGDEIPSTIPQSEYNSFMKAVAGMVAKDGKQLVGWDDALQGAPAATSVDQYWYPWPDDSVAQQAAAGGAKFVMSPADHAYLDQSYTPTEPQYGQTWAGYVEAEDAYEWDPDTTVTGVGAKSVLGVEATMFTQLTPDAQSVDFMLFPRLPEIAEVGWTPKNEQSWDSIRTRLPAQVPVWTDWGVDYYQSPEIPWSSS